LLSKERKGKEKEGGVKLLVLREAKGGEKDNTPLRKGIMPALQRPTQCTSENLTHLQTAHERGGEKKRKQNNAWSPAAPLFLVSKWFQGGKREKRREKS